MSTILLFLSYLDARGGVRTHNPWFRGPIRYPVAPLVHNLITLLILVVSIALVNCNVISAKGKLLIEKYF
ncbi:hypothetical protein LROSRS0_1180 [Furfurilactobacillus rossiae]|nr:hypothetical protein LROSRS0_1180 [Furfurilactobacillus rossiae]